MRNFLAAALLLSAACSCATVPAAAQTQNAATCRAVDVREFIAALPTNLPVLVGDKANAFAEDAHTGIDLSAVFVVEGYLIVVFNMPDGSGGRACVTIPDDDDIAAIKKHFGNPA